MCAAVSGSKLSVELSLREELAARSVAAQHIRPSHYGAGPQS